MVPNIWLLLLVRGLVGFGIGGSHVAFSLFAEFLPLKNRGVSLIMIELFWTGGTVIEAGLAWLILPTLGWRWLLGLSTIPMFILLFFSPILPESPRFLLQKGKQKQAIIVLQNVAKKK
jgi:MFS family permease